jgi:hypothetical protein
MKRLRLKLIPGNEYLFTHKRLKILQARFVRIVRAPGSDPTDEYYLECDLSSVDPSCRPASLRASDSVLLRPSMITLMQHVPDNYRPPMVEFAREMKPQRGRPSTLREKVARVLRGIRIG